MADVIEVKRVRNLYSGRGYELVTHDGHPVYAVDGILVDRFEGVTRRKIGVSLCSGCRVGCVYCFTNRIDRFRPLTADEIVAQVELALANSDWLSGDYDELKVSFKQMGDPLVNPAATLEAIDHLRRLKPETRFVVSTSGPRLNPLFFAGLSGLASDGAHVRLQFSCHTTSDDERRRLSPKLDMMNLSDLAAIARAWSHGLITLNFVVLDGFTYDPAEIRTAFRPEDVFVKVGRVDPNRCTTSERLVTASPEVVRKFEDGLAREGFTFARRLEPEDYSS